MQSVWPGCDEYKSLSHWFNLTRVLTCGFDCHDLPKKEGRRSAHSAIPALMLIPKRHLTMKGKRWPPGGVNWQTLGTQMMHRAGVQLVHSWCADGTQLSTGWHAAVKRREPSWCTAGVQPARSWHTAVHRRARSWHTAGEQFAGLTG